jgi:hypothetical protein
VRTRAEHELRFTQRDIIGADEPDVLSGDARNRTTLLVRCREGEREHRMTQDERTELATSVAAGAEHADWNLIHK